jgi:hypothetical protein
MIVHNTKLIIQTKHLLFGLILTMVNSTMAQINTVKMNYGGGTYSVNCFVNEVPMRFIFDSGASICQIGLTEALFLLKNGYLSQKDFGNNIEMSIADGSTINGRKFKIKSLKVGDNSYYGVDAIVVEELSAPLLLGQNILSKHDAIFIDYINNSIKFIDDSEDFSYTEAIKTITSSKTSLIDSIFKLNFIIKKQSEENNRNVWTIEEIQKEKELFAKYKLDKDRYDKIISKYQEDISTLKSNLQREQNRNGPLAFEINNSSILIKEFDLRNKIRSSLGFWRKVKKNSIFHNVPLPGRIFIYYPDNEKFKVVKRRIKVDKDYYKVILLKKSNKIVYELIK